MNILLIPANRNQMLNFLEICEYLPEAKTTLFDVSDMLHQDIGDLSKFDFDVIKIGITTSKPFYRYRGIKKLLYAYLARRRVLRLFTHQKYDLVLHGGESTFLYMILPLIRPAPKVIGILDGFLFLDSKTSIIKYRFYEAVRPFADRLNLAHLIPAVIGGNKTQGYYVMSEQVAEIIRGRGFSGRTIISQLPRHKDLIRERKKRGDSKKRILYSTTAFKWHGYSEFARQEEEAIQSLLECIKKLGKIDVRIRLHPRGAADYDLSKFPTEILSSHELATDLSWADCVLSAGSSISFEAAVMGTPTVVWEPSRYGLNSNSPIVKALNLPLVESIQCLTQILEDPRDNFVLPPEFDWEIFKSCLLD